VLVCPRCGATFTKEVDFCPNCGALAPTKDRAPGGAAAAGPAPTASRSAEPGWWGARTRGQRIGVALAAAALVAVVVAAVVVTRGSQGFDVEKIRPAYDAYLAVETAANTDVNYQDYGNLVEQFATQVGILVTSDLSDEERRAAESLQGALQAHQRGFEVWRESIETGTALDEEALQVAWAQAHIQAEDAVELMTAAGQRPGDTSGGTVTGSAYDAWAQTVLRNAITALATVYAETQDFTTVTLEELRSVEPAIDWVAARPGVYADPPAGARAVDNAVGWVATGAHSFEVGAWSESGTALGVKVDMTESPSTTFYTGGTASDW
jgi:hypothetical protein